MRTNEKGIILIIVLWAIVVLSTISISYVRIVNLEMQMVKFQRDNTIADTVAIAGLREAMILLREDKYKDMGDDIKSTIINLRDQDNFAYDGGSEEWADSKLYVDIPFFKKNTEENQIAYYYVDVEDESAKFPINSAQIDPQRYTKIMGHLLELTGVDDKEAETLAGAIQDWIDKDDTPTVTGKVGMGRDGSSEYAFFNPKFRPKDMRIPEVVVKNKPLDSIDELLLIPGMTPAIVYGTVQPEEKKSRGRFRSRRLRKGEYLGLKDYISVYANRINLNTVKEEVLESILFPSQGKEAESIAKDYAEFRDGRDRETYTRDDQVSKTMDGTDMEGVNFTDSSGFTKAVLTSIQDLVSIQSDTYCISSLSEYQGIEKGFQAIVARVYKRYEDLPVFGIDTINPEDLQQVYVYIRKIEPIYDAKNQIRKLS